MELLRDTDIDFMKYRKVFVIVSVALVLTAVMAVFVHGKLNVGIDFAGGTQLTLRFQDQPEVDDIRRLLAGAGYDDAQIQRFGEESVNEVMIKTPLVEGSEEGSQEGVLQALDDRFNPDVGFDLNRSGAEALADLLLQRDPEGLAAEGEEAA
ncbi:MAG: hypothetical protein PVG07_04600, partial [Acidobacteriota bacterium]